MNDFSGSELRLLYALINELILDSTQPPCVHELKDKIKTLSINHCEHDGYSKCRFCGEDFRGVNDNQ